MSTRGAPVQAHSTEVSTRVDEAFEHGSARWTTLLLQADSASVTCLQTVGIDLKISEKSFSTADVGTSVEVTAVINGSKQIEFVR